jgi:hypothetical protein
MSTKWLYMLLHTQTTFILCKEYIFGNNTDLTKYGQKKSIINIQDLDLSAASQHSIGRQPILRVIFREFSIFRKFFFFYY